MEAAAAPPSRREVKFRRRDHRCLDNILRSVSTLSDAEKFEQLKTKYVELYDQVRVAHNNLYMMEDKTKSMQHQLDTLMSDHTKSLLARSRLENLCRELQKRSKTVQEQNLAMIKEEEKLTKEFSTSLQAKLSEVTDMLQENNCKNLKLRDDNQDMAHKIGLLRDEFERSEQEIARMSTQMALEKQLAEATVAKAQFELRAERDLWTKEREMLAANLRKSEETCAQLQVNMKALESHLQMYTGKYEEFENTISKSSQVFDNCKNEMMKMTKQNGALEKELKTWKSRCEHYAARVVELVEAKQLQEAECGKAEKKVEQLQKLCRQLQVDRAAYLKLLKTNDIEPSTQMCVDATTVASQPATAKLTKKEQELVALKTNLKALEEQFATLATPSENGVTKENGVEETATKEPHDVPNGDVPSSAPSPQSIVEAGQVDVK